jgi:hypothetical protein
VELRILFDARQGVITKDSNEEKLANGSKNNPLKNGNQI